jgi:hypothetical protein
MHTFDATGTSLSNAHGNSFTSDAQQRPSIALETNDDLVAVWESVGQDGAGFGVFGRRFDSTGAALGAEFQVNTYTSGDQARPAVASDADGDFVVVWLSVQNDAMLDTLGVFAQRFSSSGARSGAELTSYTTDLAHEPAVAMDASGNLLVVWDGFAVDDPDGIIARHWSASGVPIGAEFLVNDYRTGTQGDAQIAMGPAGDFVVIWTSQRDGSGTGIFGRRFAGAALAPLDVDGNGGDPAPLTDGLLILRYLFGFRDATLIAGAVGGGCTRCTATEVAGYLAGLL